MQSEIATGEQLWCDNEQAANYPNFVSQLVQVNDAYAAVVGVSHRQVPWGTPQTTGCQIQHNLITNHPCGNCAAWIMYANWPVVVEYKVELGYFDWKTTEGHELGHGLLGLHEQYQDSGSITCLRDRTWTVMSCGTGVWEPQEFDRFHGCLLLDPNASRFAGCGFISPGPEWGVCEEYLDGSWGCFNLWGGYWQRTIWEPATYRWRESDPNWRCVEGGCP